jgi:hypothetical protein
MDNICCEQYFVENLLANFPLEPLILPEPKEVACKIMEEKYM